MCSIHSSAKLFSMFEQEKETKLYKSVWSVYLNCNINFHPCHFKGWHDKTWGLNSQQDYLLCLGEVLAGDSHVSELFPWSRISIYLPVLLFFLFSSFIDFSGGLPWSNLILIKFDGIHWFFFLLLKQRQNVFPYTKHFLSSILRLGHP